MNTACGVIRNEGFLSIAPNRAVSIEAEQIAEKESEIHSSFRTSISIGYYQVAQSLLEVSKECLKNNWDGYGAKPIDPRSIDEALKFALLLPTSIPFPEISVDADGEVIFEWYKEPNKVFSVIVESDNRIVYAGLFNHDDKVNGTEYFGDELPKTILDNLQRLFS